MSNVTTNTMDSDTLAGSPTFKALTDFSIETIIGPQPSAHEQVSALRKARHQEPAHRKVKVESSLVGLAPDEARQSASQISADASASQTGSARKQRPKNFQCPACKMAFSNNGQLKNHVRIHTGERPFVCNYTNCHKTFTRNEELTRHRMIHTGIRPHACASCGKRFGRKDHLKKHARTHERKRTRRRVFVHQRDFRGQTGNELTFCPPKLTYSKEQASMCTHLASMELCTSSCAQLPDATLSSAIVTTAPSFDLITPSPVNPLPSSLSLPLFNSNHGQELRLGSEAAVAAVASSTIQRLANDYWYNLLGIYQQHDPNHMMQLRNTTSEKHS